VQRGADLRRSGIACREHNARHHESAAVRHARRDRHDLNHGVELRAGLISNFTGIDSLYEAPEKPELKLDTGSSNPEALAEAVLVELRRRHVV
ncbi:MAG TPA: adenylyl-sulfate kinase, partial [Methyloceanibacter sp.]|nr:adenylyl-sulfate kinase [Methyloceanibacter sp.]